MISSFLKGIVLSSLVSVVLYVVTVIIAYCRYWKEKRDAVVWGIDIITCLGEIAGRITPIVNAWDDESFSGKQLEFWEKYADATEGILKSVHEYLVAIEKPRRGCIATKFKTEVEQRIKELDILSRVLGEREEKTK